MKLLIITPHFRPAVEWGGPVKSIWNMAKGLACLGVEVTVLTTNAKQYGITDVPTYRIEEDVRIITKRVINRGRSAFVNRYGVASGIALGIANNIRKSDIIHLNGFFGYHSICSSLSRFLWNKPIIVSARGNLDSWSLNQKRVKKQLFLKTFGRLLFDQAADVHFTVEEERKQAPSWLLRDKGFVVPNSIEFGNKGNKIRFRKKIGVSIDTLLLGIFGRIHQKKGFDVIINSLRNILRNDCVLIVVGHDENGYKTKVNDMIEKEKICKKVIFTGLLSGQELSDAYAGIDFLVVPSYEENFGNVIIEATAQGIPCMVSEHVGLKNWIIENDVGLVLSMDPRAWAKEIDQIKKNRISLRWSADRLSKVTRNTFSIKTVAKQMLEEYERILGSY